MSKSFLENKKSQTTLGLALSANNNQDRALTLPPIRDSVNHHTFISANKLYPILPVRINYRLSRWVVNSGKKLKNRPVLRKNKP
jgi:hypothetical protein